MSQNRDRVGSPFVLSDYHAATITRGPCVMISVRFITSCTLASLAAAGTYASLAPTGFGALAIVPAFFVAIVVLAPIAPRLS